MKTIMVNYSGEYPNLCRGEWEIFIDHKMIELPENIKRSPMDTYKSYSSWSFDENYSVVWEEYKSGLVFTEWIKDEKCDAIKKAAGEFGYTLEYFELVELYKQINDLDFRHNSCGGCI